MDIINLFKHLTEHPQGTFHTLQKFNDSKFGAVDIKGFSPVWEMHPDTDEFFYIIEGVLEIELYEQTGIAHYTADAGSTFVVPKDIWHKPGAPNGVKILYFTPGKSLHSDAKDPREQNQL